MFCKKKTKRFIALFLAAMITASLSACGGNTSTDTKQDGSVKNVTTQTAEKVKLTIGGEDWTNSADVKFYPSDTLKEYTRITGIELETYNYTPDKLKLLLAGGDLPDLLTVDQSYIKQLIEGDQIVAMDNMLTDHGKNLVTYSQKRLDFMKKYFSNNTDKLYFVTPQIGSEGHSYNLWNGYIVRWDYYTELGYPEVKTDDDMLKVLSDIQKKHPTTPDGKKTYGYGFWTDQQMWPWHIRAKANFGFADWGPEEYVIRISNNTIVNNYVDLSSPFWTDMKYYNKAYNLGLIDPDSFTQLNADYGAKGKSGVYLSGPVTWGMDTNYWEEAKKDPNTLALPISIPVEGVYSYTDSITDIGWTNKMLCITKSSKTPERAMDFINSMNDPDIIRLLYSGIKGKDWDIIDGRPQLKPETVAASADPNGADAWEKRGIGYFNQNVIGLSGWFMNPKDNAPLNLFNDKSVWLGKLKPAEKNFSTHYGVEYPFQAHENLVKQGKAFTQENLKKDIPNALVTAPDDIKRIQVKVEEIALKAVPKLIMAKNNDEFAKEQNKLIADLKAAGQDTSWTWWQKAWAEAKAVITEK